MPGAIRAAGQELGAWPGERVLILGNHDLELRAELAAVLDTSPVLVLTHVPLRRPAADGRQRPRPRSRPAGAYRPPPERVGRVEPG